jgi:sugar phosphate isomerase/epimerase
VQKMPIVISLSSFGAAEVKRHGQAKFIDIAKEAGADGVEIRSELLSLNKNEISLIAEQAKCMLRVFSCASPLFSPNGELLNDNITYALECAEWLRADIIKFSMGGGSKAPYKQLERLSALVGSQADAISIENDQSNQAGSMFHLKKFFEKSLVAGLKWGMTFDIGNWHWVGECPQKASEVFADHVRYVHTKGVYRHQLGKWVAVPLAESQAPWKTILDSLPFNTPWAIEYPLMGDDLVQVTKREVEQLRVIQGERYVG